MATDPWTLFGTTPTGVLTTLKRDGRPQLSNVAYLYDPATRVALISVTDDRAKTRNLRRDPRASFYVTTANLDAYAVGEGLAELGAVAEDPQDDATGQLVAHYRALRGEHPDWAAFREAMVGERRLLIRLPLTRAYGWGLAP
ncbi:PPOX class F420-dependent oxidoreductase [Streptomyces sp. NPDC088725]|uniref:PPOX class F420-dependent oxidoreductase n=1 Tax=Streptomyces sp. NPDC088725 TaxID=3365873 RepID=UPI0038109A88